MTAAVVKEFGWVAVGVGEVRVQVDGAAEGFEGGGVLFAGEAGEDALAEGGPGGNGEDFTAGGRRWGAQRA